MALDLSTPGPFRAILKVDTIVPLLSYTAGLSSTLPTNLTLFHSAAAMLRVFMEVDCGEATASGAAFSSLWDEEHDSCGLAVS